MKGAVLIILTIFLLASCAFNDEAKLPPIEERLANSVSSLTELLVAPQDGWRVEYQPTNETGIFFILMDFNEDGTVRIQSDVTANDGEFRDHVVSYRIDNAQGTELILETYGVFHYMFELQQASFGAEFEFFFIEESSDNLIFRSKTDGGLDPTTIVFQEAGPDDAQLISTEAMPLLAQGIFQTENLAGIGSFATHNIYVQEDNHTISASFDLDRRVVKFVGAAVGQTITEIATNNTRVTPNISTSFSLSNERVVLDNEVTITLGGTSHVITEIPVENFAGAVQEFCTGVEDSISTFSSSGVPGLGNITIQSSLFQASNSFQPDIDDGFYSVNHVFIYDENDSTIAEDIETVYPTVAAFQWYFGRGVSGDSILNAVGFVILDDFNNPEFFLRGFDFVQNGNLVEMTFNGEDLIDAENPTTEELNGLDQLTDQIFAGGTVYVLDIITIEGLFEFYNPCNGYKGFIIQPN